MSHVERRQREKEETRTRILTAAREIAAKEGWHSVTIRKIADKIEYTPPIVYEYFENKEDLFKELVYSGFEILQERFAEASRIEPDPKKLMSRIALIHLDFALEHTELFQLMFNLERQAPNETMKYNLELMERTIRQITKAEGESVRELVFGFLCLSHGAISFMLQIEKGNWPRKPKDFRSMYARIIERYINTL